MFHITGKRFINTSHCSFIFFNQFPTTRRNDLPELMYTTVSSAVSGSFHSDMSIPLNRVLSDRLFESFHSCCQDTQKISANLSRSRSPYAHYLVLSIFVCLISCHVCAQLFVYPSVPPLFTKHCVKCVPHPSVEFLNLRVGTPHRVD